MFICLSIELMVIDVSGNFQLKTQLYITIIKLPAMTTTCHERVACFLGLGPIQGFIAIV